MKTRAISLLLTLALLFSLVPASLTVLAAPQEYTAYADTLNRLGLFAGTGKGYELERSATRAEAAVMVVKLLGKDAQAKEEAYEHPFTDVPAWADCYVGYIYKHSITSGVSATEFGSSYQATPAQYATFMLKSLGYTSEDFEWTEALAKMVELGILTQSEATAYGATHGISRGVVVAISRAALLACPKGSYYTLLNRLYTKDQAFDASMLETAAKRDADIAQRAALRGVPSADNAGVKALDSEGVYAKSSSAVFYIEVFISGYYDDYPDYFEDDEDYEEWPYATGSGFFISSDGIAVTNYHVIEDTDRAKIRTTDGKTYDVDRVLGCSEEADIAILKIKGSGFPYLKLADPYSLRIAQRIYCIGSPLGYENTISDGLVSSTIKKYTQIDDRELIQISAPISHGSSGGVVLNEYGDVVGITTMGYDGEVLNFAVPVTEISNVKLLDPPKTMKAIAFESLWAWPDWVDSLEEEGENGEEPAQTLVDYTEYVCAIEDMDDVDLFGIDSETPNELKIRLRADEAYIGHLMVEVVDLETGEPVMKTTAVEQVPYKHIYDHVKKGANYALRVRTDGDESINWKNVRYEFFCEATETAKDYWEGEYISEEEPNDDFDNAQFAPYCAYLNGSLSDKTDKDYYRFYVDETAEVTIPISFFAYSYSTDSTVTLQAELYNGKTQKRIATLKATDSWEDGEQHLNKRTLEPGTYYVLLTSSSTFDYFRYNMYIGPELDDDDYANRLQPAASIR